MSDDNIRLYRRDLTATNPFGKTAQTTNVGRSGSDWALPQIEWLGINFEWSCAIEQLLGSGSDFRPGSQLQRSISEDMGMPWAKIINDQNIDRNSFYGHLSGLARIRTPLGDYDKSSTIEGISSPPVSPDRRDLSPFSTTREEEMTSPGRQFSSSPPQMPAPHTPDPKRQYSAEIQNQGHQSPRSSPLSSPPAIIKTPPQFPQHDTKRSPGPWSSPLSSPPAIIKTPPQFPQFPQHDTRRSPALSSPTSRGSASSEITGFHASSGQVASEPPLSDLPKIPRDQLQAEHKAEKEVEDAAGSFLRLLGNCIGNLCASERPRPWDLDLRVRSGTSTEHYIIDNYMIMSNPDAMLIVTMIDTKSSTNNREVRLLLECKPAEHRRTADQIFGQEVAEMLIEARRMKEYHQFDHYTVFLISWHHLECYFSRMDVTDDYLNQLKDTSRLPIQKPPYVRQTNTLSLRDERERVEIGHISARLVIEMLAGYNNPKKLGVIEHLRS